MSFTRITTITKTTDSPANAFNSWPVLTLVATPEQITTYQQQYLVDWSSNRSDTTMTNTVVYENEEAFNQSKLEPMSIAIWELRQKWLADNHLIQTNEIIQS